MNLMEKNDPKRKFSLRARLRSFGYAFRGIATLIAYEHNARIHLFILVFAIILGILLRIGVSGWMAILFVTGLVFVSECFNTAVEYLSDNITGERNEKIKRAKDVAAAGVLISALISVITGLIIFLPGIINLVKNGSLLPEF
jgi:diacylglycerol kinase